MFLFRSFIFYPLLALAAAGLILLSLGSQPWATRTPASQSGAPGQGGAVVFGPAALARLDPGASHLIFSPRNGEGLPQTLHIALKNGEANAPAPTSPGARLLLASALASQFAGQAVKVDVDIRPLPIMTASQLALSWQGADGPVVWSQADTGSEAKTLSFTLPAVATPQALGLYVLNPNSDATIGIEISEIRLSAAN